VSETIEAGCGDMNAAGMSKTLESGVSETVKAGLGEMRLA
jgi:hypothetical protein